MPPPALGSGLRHLSHHSSTAMAENGCKEVQRNHINANMDCNFLRLFPLAVSTSGMPLALGSGPGHLLHHSSTAMSKSGCKMYKET